MPPEEVERLTRQTLESYESALTQPRIAPGALQATRDAIRLAQREQIAVILVLPPEGSVLRNRAPAAAERHAGALRALAADMGVSLIDARTWIDDNAFFDGHHAFRRGAEQYTQRFAREALVPYRYLWQAQIAVAAGASAF
jgi:hypothetical protein